VKYLLLVITFLLVSCAEKPETQLKVSIGALGVNTNFDGGLVLLGKSNNGFRVSKVIPEVGDQVEIFLPNGTWNFAVIGWDSAGNDQGIMEADNYCDFKANIALNGGEVPLLFNATQANCVNPIFGNNLENTNQFAKFEFNSCVGLTQKLQEIGGIANVPDGTQCNGGGAPLPGEYKSFKVIIPEAIAGNNQLITNGGLASACYNNGGDSNIPTTQLRIPMGSVAVTVPIVVRAYTNTSCDSTTVKDYAFSQGLNNPAIGVQGHTKHDVSNDKTSVYLNSVPCSPEMLAAQGGADFPSFTTGGTPNSYLICSADDLDHVADGVNGDLDGYYELGRNIDLNNHSGTYASITGFQGTFKGNGFTISNGAVPLFDDIQNGGSEVFIADFNLDNFSITTTGAKTGVLANTLGTGSSGSEGVEIFNVNITNSDISTAAGSNKVGGLIGEIVAPGSLSGTNNKFFIRHCNVQVDIDASSTTVNNQLIGGLIGFSQGITQNENIALEANFVGVNNIDNISDRTKASTITYNGVTDVTSSAVGGMIGKSQATEIRDFNVALTNITAVQNVGGLVGTADDLTQIENSVGSLIYTPMTGCNNGNNTVPFTGGNCNSIGGIVGNIVKDSTVGVLLNGVISYLEISNNSETVDFIGGLVGYNDEGTGAINLEVMDSRSHNNVLVDGSYHGGFFGYTFKNALPGHFIVRRSIAHGGFQYASAAGSYKGGFSGYAENMNFFMSIADITLNGSQYLGGGIGYLAGDSQIKESYLKSTITSPYNIGGSNAQFSIGGAIGYLNAAQTSATQANAIEASAVLDTKIDTAINASAVTLTDAFTNRIGLTFGEIGTGFIDPNDSQGTTIYKTAIERSIAEGTVASLGGDLPNAICGQFDTTNTIQGGTPTYFTCSATDISIDLSIDETISPSAGPWSLTGSIYTPTFELAWKSIGYDNTENIYLAGSKLEPFRIASPDDWNAIGTDEYLLQKTFELTANIDFDGETFEPIGIDYTGGDIENSFRGQLLSNGYKIMNVTYSPANVDAGSGVGLINFIDKGKIGDRHNPFVFENILIECTGDNICGLVAKAKVADLFIDARNVTIDSGAASQLCLGGLLGKVTDDTSTDSNVNIEHSRFLGFVDGYNGGGSALGVGGFIGCVGEATPNANSVQASINESVVILKGLRGDDEVGGMIGSLRMGVDSFKIDNSYVYLVPDNTYTTQVVHESGNSSYGGLIGLTDVDPTINNIYVDFAQGTVDDFDTLNVFFGAGMATAPTLTQLGYVDYPSGFTAGDQEITIGSDANVFTATSQATMFSATGPGGTLNLNSSQDDMFVLDGNRVKLRWEVFGHNN
jgi:hypothetical protein